MLDRIRVLVVDDDARLRTLVVRALEQQRCICDDAEDGSRALEMIAANQYDAVVTDWRMPRLQGSTLITSLLNLDVRPAIVVITGVTEQEELQRLGNREIEGIFAKPLDLEALASEVKLIADRRRKLWLQQPLLNG
jgi:DNA-binding response OmpR family regulator